MADDIKYANEQAKEAALKAFSDAAERHPMYADTLDTYHAAEDAARKALDEQGITDRDVLNLSVQSGYTALQERKRTQSVGLGR